MPVPPDRPADAPPPDGRDRGPADADRDPAPADAEDAQDDAGLPERLPPPPTSPAPATGPLARLRAVNESDRLLELVARLRGRLPGDSQFGDPLSTAESGELRGSASLRRQIARLAGQQTGGVLHELGLGALQVWQAAAESSGRGRGDADLTVLFTDLVGFSHWALEAGDHAALLLLREVAGVLDPAVSGHRGRVVKWLGDGMMAVFREPVDALRAVEDANARLATMEVAGYQPRIRAGMHHGRPRRVGSDYLGIDVNIAARVAQAAGTGELLASDRTVELLDPEQVASKRRRRFRAKGVPAEVTVYAVRSR
ncbi:Purine cyclase-related protein [Patulibacter medicamentivorans]|uniref:Purine cyclase-related protein n=1 Tax=Patulibacter medicamentivorans TaxID=1097667 RepID=H0E536_9ACTN|nr:adenylate/guanylate cyclase domain-containing protein [Patulibacter medicamentivorans]EHN11203.1 Purine cyclase-related protein [Patulibacter medicamentivorans]